MVWRIRSSFRLSRVFQEMSRTLTNAFAVALPLLLFSGLAVASACSSTDFDEDDTSAIIQKKIEYALAVISDSEYLAKNPWCVTANMRFLGLAHAPNAIPALVALLGYQVPPRTGHLTTNSDLYPAISALDNIGEPVVPALIEVLATKDNDTTESKNAVDALMDIRVYRDDLDKPLKALKQAAARESDPIRAARLNRAIQDSRNTWCRFGARCSE